MVTYIDGQPASGSFDKASQINMNDGRTVQDGYDELKASLNGLIKFQDYTISLSGGWVKSNSGVYYKNVTSQIDSSIMSKSIKWLQITWFSNVVAPIVPVFDMDGVVLDIMSSVADMPNGSIIHLRIYYKD